MIPVIDMTEPARCVHDCIIFYAGFSKCRGLRSKAEWRGRFVAAVNAPESRKAVTAGTLSASPEGREQGA